MKINEDTVWIVSYPRSGNTWMRFLLANLLYPDSNVNYITVDRLIPDFHQIKKWEKLGVIQNPLIVKSHYLWQLEYSKVVYMCRDVRDVSLSCYYFDCARERITEKMPFDKYLKEIFLRGDMPFGTWGTHADFWMATVVGVPFILIKYEELWQHPCEEMERVAKFLNVGTEGIQVAIDKSDFDELEKIRARDGVDPRIKGLNGKPGGWKKVLTEKQQDLIWKRFGTTAMKLGYRKELIR